MRIRNMPYLVGETHMVAKSNVSKHNVFNIFKSTVYRTQFIKILRGACYLERLIYVNDAYIVLILYTHIFIY